MMVSAMAEEAFIKVGHFKEVGSFCAHLQSIGVTLPVEERILSADEGSPLAKPIDVGGFVVANRWCIHAMEGWDGTATGEPTEHTVRRWKHFGASGAKLIWGGEAFAVQGDGRANPRQLGVIDEDLQRAERGLRLLLETLRGEHRARFGGDDDLLVGLQLTHSGRFCKPNDPKAFEPKIAYRHPLLDRRVGVSDDSFVISDDYVERLIDRYVAAAKLAQRVGFGFVDVKHCHGYLGHEFLSAFTRAGKFGGDFEGRTRFAREIVGRIRSECPGLMVGVRLSAFDVPPFRPDPAGAKNGKLGAGVPEDFGAAIPYVYGFGCNPNHPLEMDLTEPIRFIKMLNAMGVRMINVSCGSPYYNPHVQRPAIFPPSDGYQPPEDPLVGVDRQIQCVRRLKEACPESILVGTGYSYLQEYLPHVAQGIVRENWADFVGLGRMVLSYWDLPADTLAGREFQGRRLCRTFSDCTSAPRNGIISGCYPLDAYYKDAGEHVELKTAKVEMRKRMNS